MRGVKAIAAAQVKNPAAVFGVLQGRLANSVKQRTKIALVKEIPPGADHPLVVAVPPVLSLLIQK